MNSQRLGAAAFVAFATMTIGATGGLFAADPQVQKDPPPKKAETPSSASKATDAERALQEEMRKHARLVFELNLKRYQSGTGLVVEEMYVWSCRWLESELALATDATGKTGALKAHLARMQDIAKIAEALAKVGQGLQADAAAGAYYRAQAELWLSKGRMR